MNADPVLEAFGVSVPSGSAGGRAPLEGPLSLRLGPGEALAVTGPSGAGKSTLLRVLARLDARATGEVRHRGKLVVGAAVPAFRRRVQYLPQAPVRLAGSLLDNLAAPFGFASARGNAWDPGRARNLAASLGLAEATLETPASDLSGGEAQRMALARALLLEPEVLLLDEPTASLDDDARVAAEEAIRAWHGAHPERALVLVSHAVDQQTRLTTRTLALARDGAGGAGA